MTPLAGDYVPGRQSVLGSPNDPEHVTKPSDLEKAASAPVDRRAINPHHEDKASGASDDVHHHQPRYRVERISAHRFSEAAGVELLVHWGEEFAHDMPTWEPEDVLWEDCREVVLRYWSPNGVSTRTRRLGLQRSGGSYTIARILKKKLVRDEAYYQVEWVGYVATTWEPVFGLPSAIIEA